MSTMHARRTRRVCHIAASRTTKRLIAVIRRDEFKLHTHISIDLENEYFKKIRTRWGYALREVFSELPDPNW